MRGRKDNMELRKKYVGKTIPKHCPADMELGVPRYGVIRKEVRLYSPSYWCKDVDYSFVGFEIDTSKKTIKITPLMGSLPLANSLFLALLADRDVRRLIKEYQNDKERQEFYKLWSTSGSSGREDVFITKVSAPFDGNFAVTKTTKLCHISGFGRLNEGFGTKGKMYIGDFVELVAYLGLAIDDMKPKSLRKLAGGVKYVKPKFIENYFDFENSATHIL